MEQKLEVLKKALEMGAQIDITFFDLDLNEAQKKVSELGRELGKKAEYRTRNNSQWFQTESEIRGINITGFGPNIEEDAI